MMSSQYQKFCTYKFILEPNQSIKESNRETGLFAFYFSKLDRMKEQLNLIAFLQEQVWCYEKCPLSIPLKAMKQNWFIVTINHY